MKAFLFALLMGFNGVAYAHADSTLYCNYDWDITHESGITIEEEAALPVQSDLTKIHVKVSFFHPSRVANNPPVTKSEIMSYSSMHTRLGIETSYSIDFENGDQFFVSHNDYFNGGPSDSLTGFFALKGGQSQNITCSFSP